MRVACKKEEEERVPNGLGPNFFDPNLARLACLLKALRVYSHSHKYYCVSQAFSYTIPLSDIKDYIRIVSDVLACFFFTLVLICISIKQLCEFHDCIFVAVNIS